MVTLSNDNPLSYTTRSGYATEAVAGAVWYAYFDDVVDAGTSNFSSTSERSASSKQ